MHVVPVSAPDELARFIELSWQICGNDPQFVPPLRAALLAELAGKNTFAKYGRMQLFLCGDAGRIAAIINPRLRDEDGAPIGMLGYFECRDDLDIARALFDAGMTWLRAEGAKRVVGPMNGGAHRSHRLIVRGFEQDPFLFEPRNPPHYPRFFEAQGFRVVQRWFSYDLSRRAIEEMYQPLKAMTERFKPRGVIETIDPSRPADALARLHAILNQMWGDHIGYAPIDLDEFTEVFGGVLAVVGKEEALGIVVAGGKDVGWGLQYPDWVDEVRALNGDASRWAHWMNAARASRLVFHTIALIPDGRSSGNGLLVLERGVRRFLEQDYASAVIAVVMEGFPFTAALTPTREYVLYGRDL